MNTKLCIYLHVNEEANLNDPEVRWQHLVPFAVGDRPKLRAFEGKEGIKEMREEGEGGR